MIREKSMLETLDTTDVCQLKGNLFTLTVVQLLSLDSEGLHKQLQHLRHQVPHFFQQTPVVLDMKNVSEECIDLAAILEILREHTYQTGRQTIWCRSCF